MKIPFSIFILAVLLSGCSVFGYEKREALGAVELYPAKAHAYQLRLPYRVYGRGNVHHPFVYDKRDYLWADWFFLTSNGAIATSDGTIHPCAEGHEKSSLYGKRSVRGDVRLSASTAVVALQVLAGTNIDDTPVWEEYEHNGTYTLVRPEHKPSDAAPTSSAECLP